MIFARTRERLEHGSDHRLSRAATRNVKLGYRPTLVAMMTRSGLTEGGADDPLAFALAIKRCGIEEIDAAIRGLANRVHRRAAFGSRSERRATET